MKRSAFSEEALASSSSMLDGGASQNEEKVKDNGSMRKRGATAEGSGVSEKALSPLQCRSKKTSVKELDRHRRRSPSLHVATSSAECFTGAPRARTLQQSASSSGGVTVQASPTPRKAARRGPSSARGEEEAAAFGQGHNVQVFVRARPVNGAESALQGDFARCVRQEGARTISWRGQPETRFTFDHVAGEFVTQGGLFQMSGLPMVDNSMAGYNSCMFAYGQTGSGKTYTMMGDVKDYENRGLTPRVFEYLFTKIRKEEEEQKERKVKYNCRFSFLEIYNEQISDLLEPSSTNLQMREDVKRGVFVEGLLEVEVKNVEDVLRLLLLGAKNRKVAATNMNKESSRSHCVLTCVIESQWECDSMINFRFGRLNLVDLAGSERQKDTGADEERLREAASINKSLSTLGLVIMVLVDIANGKQRHVPYRDSKLTFLLQDSLGGNSKTTIIANISPSSCASSETLSTLKFAQRAKFIQNNAVINEELASGDVKGLQEQIQQLKDELASIRRQSVRLSERKDGISAGENTGDAKDGLNPLRLELESSQEECTEHKQALATFQLKETLEVNCLELNQAQHQNAVLELKTILQKSEEKAGQEMIRRNQAELRLQEALQESTNLQTELQWTRDSLEGAEAVVETFQQSEPAVLEIGDPEAFMYLGQLQAEIIEMRARLEDERRHRRKLEDQIKANNGTLLKFANKLTDGYPTHHMSTENPCYAKQKRKVKHKEAILQLQMEIASIDCGVSDHAIKDYRWEDGPLSVDVEALESALAGERQNLTKAKVSGDRLRQQLEDSTQSELNAEKALNVVDSDADPTGKGNDLKSTNQEDGEFRAAEQLNWVLEISELQVALRGSEERYVENNQIISDLEMVLPSSKNSEDETATVEIPDSSHQRSDEVAALAAQSHVSDRQIFKLECQGVELRAAMQRQAVAFGALYEQLQKQGSLQILEEERAVFMACRKKVERCQAKLRKLESQVEALQQELERMQLLRKEIVLIYEELHDSRSSAEMTAQETERLRILVEDLKRSRSELEEDVKRKQCAVEALEVHLLKSKKIKLQYQKKLHLCEQKAELNKTRAQEKQVEVEILGKSVEELENTVYALESQAGLLKREGERQCMVKEDIERELQGLKEQNVNLRASLSQITSASGDEVKREFNTERKLEKREAEIQLLFKKLEKDQVGLEEEKSFPQLKNIQKCKKTPKRSIGSVFKCFKMNHQVNSELHEEREAYERRIQDLGSVRSNRQNEVTALKEKLADVERLSRDVLRILPGVKVDMASGAVRGHYHFLRPTHYHFS